MKQLRNAFSFFTIIPLAHPVSIEEVAAACYLAPLVAVAVGTSAGIAGWGTSKIFGVLPAAALALAASLLLAGLHHSDGLADMGDALMARGDSRRRLAVLKDRTLGVGAVVSLLLTYLISWTALAEIFRFSDGALFVWYLASAELAARMALLVNAAVSHPSHPGSGSFFLTAARGWRGLTGIALSSLCLLMLMIPLGPAAPLLAAAAAILVAMLLSLAGRFWFGGVGGDILGATVELGRMSALLALAAAVNAWPSA